MFCTGPVQLVWFGWIGSTYLDGALALLFFLRTRETDRLAVWGIFPQPDVSNPEYLNLQTKTLPTEAIVTLRKREGKGVLTWKNNRILKQGKCSSSALPWKKSGSPSRSSLACLWCSMQLLSSTLGHWNPKCSLDHGSAVISQASNACIDRLNPRKSMDSKGTLSHTWAWCQVSV